MSLGSSNLSWLCSGEIQWKSSKSQLPPLHTTCFIEEPHLFLKIKPANESFWSSKLEDNVVMLSDSWQIINYLRSPLLCTAAAALPPEFLQQSEHQIEAMGHAEPGQAKMNPTYPTNLFNLITSCFCKGKDGGEQIPANTLMDEKLPRLMLNKLPRKASRSLLSLLAGPSVASNASTVIPDTACSWTFCPQSWEALTILGRRLSKSCLLERKVLNEKCNNQDFDIQLESNMHKRFN